MILEQQVNMDSIAAKSVGCSNGRCYNCPFSLICPKSPLCVLKNNVNNNASSNNIDNALITIKNTMDNINNNTNNMYINIMNNIENMFNKLEDNSNNVNFQTEMSNFQNEIYKLYNDINEKISYVMQKINDIKTSNVEIKANNDEQSIGNGIVPYQNVSEEIPTYVEKKTIFGKTKWVEKK